MAKVLLEYSLLESDDAEEFMSALTNLSIKGAWVAEGNMCVTYVPPASREPNDAGNPLKGHFHYTQLLGKYFYD